MSSGKKYSELDEILAVQDSDEIAVASGGESLKATFQQIAEYIYGKIFPVGYIYISVDDTNPGTLFGGSWTRIKDKFLLSAGDTYSAGSTGGEASHKLTVNEIPSHNHSTYYQENAASGSARRTPAGPSGTELSTGTSEVGGGQAHNNMPPCLTVYVWKRTA